MNRIRHAHVSSNGILRLSFHGDSHISIRLDPLTKRGGLFSELMHDIAFTQVTIGERGLFISKPNGLELCADALRQWDQR